MSSHHHTFSSVVVIVIASSHVVVFRSGSLQQFTKSQNVFFSFSEKSLGVRLLLIPVACCCVLSVCLFVCLAYFFSSSRVAQIHVIHTVDSFTPRGCYSLVRSHSGALWWKPEHPDLNSSVLFMFWLRVTMERQQNKTMSKLLFCLRKWNEHHTAIVCFVSPLLAKTGAIGVWWWACVVWCCCEWCGARVGVRSSGREGRLALVWCDVSAQACSIFRCCHCCLCECKCWRCWLLVCVCLVEQQHQVSPPLGCVVQHRQQKHCLKRIMSLFAPACVHHLPVHTPCLQTTFGECAQHASREMMFVIHHQSVNCAGDAA